MGCNLFIEFILFYPILQPNHLTGIRGSYLMLKFIATDDLIAVKRDLNPAVQKNKSRANSQVINPDMLSRFVSFFYSLRLID